MGICCLSDLTISILFFRKKSSYTAPSPLSPPLCLWSSLPPPRYPLPSAYGLTHSLPAIPFNNDLLLYCSDSCYIFSLLNKLYNVVICHLHFFDSCFVENGNKYFLLIYLTFQSVLVAGGRDCVQLIVCLATPQLPNRFGIPHPQTPNSSPATPYRVYLDGGSGGGGGGWQAISHLLP